MTYTILKLSRMECAGVFVFGGQISKNGIFIGFKDDEEA